MIKRIICILLVVLIFLMPITGCKDSSEILSNVDTTTSEVLKNKDETSEQPLNESSKDNSSQNNTGTNKDTNSINSTTSSKDKVNSNSNQSTSSKNQTQSTTSSSANSSTDTQVRPLVIKGNNTLYKNYPEVTTAYKYPDNSIKELKQNNTGIYENMYAKVDTTTAKQGYLLITYKDPWAQKIDFALSETASHSGKYQKTHYYYYNKGDFSQNKPIALALPKTDAIYYLVVASEINGAESNKLEIDLGQITVDGYASYQDMVPTEEQIQMNQTSSGIYTNKYVKINTNTASKGYIEIEYLDASGYDINVSVCSNKKNAKGNLASWEYRSGKHGKCKINSALTYGNAEYTITVTSTMKNDSTGVERVSKKATLTVNLSNVSSTGAFLLSTGEVNFDANMLFIKKANEISASCKDDFEKVSKIYDWMTEYIKYQVVEETIQGEYICDLNNIYNRKTGVCYDYAVVLAAMLRSQGIPCKVVFGSYADSTSGNGHVWNEVYIAKNGSIKSNELSIVGNKWCTLDPTLSHVNSGQSAIDYMNNTSNYIWRAYY